MLAAAAGQAALIHLDGSLATTQIYNGSLFVNLSVKVGAAAFVQVGTPAYGNFSSGSATASVTKLYPLTAGTDYIFGASFESSAVVTINLAKSSCHSTVTIVKQ